MRVIRDFFTILRINPRITIAKLLARVRNYFPATKKNYEIILPQKKICTRSKLLFQIENHSTEGKEIMKSIFLYSRILSRKREILRKKLAQNINCQHRV